MHKLNSDTILFLGRPGCGKGMQRMMLQDFIEQKVLCVEHVYLGDEFRELAKEVNVAGRWMKRLLDDALLPPAWIAQHYIIKALLETVDRPQDVLLFDGCPRRIGEAMVLDEACVSLERLLPVCVQIDVPAEVCFDRLIRRGRSDDSPQFIRKRLEWYDEDVIEVLDYYLAKSRLIVIDGNRPIEEVFEDIKKNTIEVLDLEM